MKSLTLISGRLKPGNVLTGLVCFIVLVCVALVASTAWQMNQSARERMDNAKMGVANIVRAAEQQARDTVRQTENTLRDLAERVEVDGLDPAQKSRLSGLMARKVESAEGLQGLFIYNERGDWVANSFFQGQTTKNNSDRAYFIYHRDHDDKGMHIGSILTSRTTGELVIPVSMRLQHADGSFAGVALATLSVGYFQRFFERLSVDDKGVIFLALSNGDLLARRPTIEGLMTTNVSNGDIFKRYLPESDSGTAVITSIVDGVERIYAYRQLQDLPLVTAAGLSSEYVFASWWSYVYRSVAVISLIILALGLLGGVIFLQIRRCLEAEGKLSKAHQALELLAQTDSLTGLANRRYFDEALEREWGRARRTNSSLAIILIDIDWFKQFNDNYGHLEGDDCLKKVATLIRASVKRPSDITARYGGEEFVVLLPDTDVAGAYRVAENIRRVVNKARFQHSGSPLERVSLSGGVSAIVPNDARTPAELLAKADHLLYCAKRGGRNRMQRDMMLVPVPVEPEAN